MFQGTIPRPLRSIVLEHAASWPPGDVYVGCSGNMTIERTLAETGRRLHSNDVNPYTCALGWYCSGQHLDYRVQDDAQDRLAFLAPYLADGGPNTLATIMLSTRMLAYEGKTTPYHLRMQQGWRDQWATLHADAVERVRAIRLTLASFFPGDVRDYLSAIPPDAPVLLFPPFWEKGYAKLFAGLEAAFSWPQPSYRPIDDDGKQEIIDLVSSRPHWLLGLQTINEDLADYRVGFVQLAPKAIPIWVYASPGRSRMVGPRQRTEVILMPKIGPDEELDGELRLHVLNPGQFNALRSMFLDTRIEPRDPMVCLGVSCGGKLIGAFGFKLDSTDGLGVYLMADFPIGWSRYRRLSKLIVMAAMSRETQHLLQRLRSHRTIRWATTAFADNPISGKYGRGIPGVRLYQRKEGDGAHRYQLTYVGPLGEWTLQEALEMWRAKHGKVLR